MPCAENITNMRLKKEMKVIKESDSLILLNKKGEIKGKVKIISILAFFKFHLENLPDGHELPEISEEAEAFFDSLLKNEHNK